MVSKRWILLLAMGWASVSLGQTMPASQPAADVSALPITLGEPFVSHGAGIELDPPDGGTLIRDINSGDIVRFVYSDRGWDIHVKMTRSTKPVQLSAKRDAMGVGGLMELTIDQLMASNPSAKVLISEVRDYSPYKVGIIVARYNAGINQVFTQQAIFRFDDQTYYVIQFTSAAGDAAEASATQAFGMILGTVKLHDLAELRKEQDDRVIHTKGFFSELDEKQIRSILQPMQMLRVIRDGKDVGYVQVTEKPATHVTRDGVEISMQSRVFTPAVDGAANGGQIDRVSNFFVAFDRSSEDWTVVTTVADGKSVPQRTTEMGNSNKEVKEELDKEALKKHVIVDPTDPKQPPVKKSESYNLSVNVYMNQRASQPFNKPLPWLYLPQAVGQMLPRLLPLSDPENYMFASYVSAEHEVMYRYVDVEKAAEVEFDGRKQLAVVVKDRMGVDGSPTLHYLTPEGQWLGSVNEDQKLTVLPSDIESIQMIWKDAKIGTDAANTAGKADGTLQVR
jgi:hypothetical protein